MINDHFTIKDHKTGAYLQPFYSTNQSTAIRSILDLVADPQHNFAKHPSDYALYRLGTFDDSTARYDLHDSPLCIGNLDELYKPSPLLKEAG